jgi:hypothetical protein
LWRGTSAKQHSSSPHSAQASSVPPKNPYKSTWNTTDPWTAYQVGTGHNQIKRPSSSPYSSLPSRKAAGSAARPCHCTPKSFTMTAEAIPSDSSGSFDFEQAKAALTSSSTNARTAQLRSLDDKISHQCKLVWSSCLLASSLETQLTAPSTPSSGHGDNPLHPQASLLDPCLLHRPPLSPCRSTLPRLTLSPWELRHPDPSHGRYSPGDPEAGHRRW